MVFPSSSPPDAHAASELKTRLHLILRLADAGVLVLLDQGKPEQFGLFVRTLLQVDERLDVLTSAYGLAKIAPGSCAVLVPDVRESAWMNQERPILAQRRLRVLMYCDKPVAAEIARGAPDFFHWISHWIQAPQGIWPPALSGLRNADARKLPISWEGDDFDKSFVASFGETTRITLSASMPYAELVNAFQQQHEWIVLTDVDGPFRARRVHWAYAESGRKGRLVVLRPKTHIKGFSRVTAKPQALKESETELSQASSAHAAKLASILDCETEAIQIAASLLATGVSENDCLAVWRDEDPGIALVHLAEAHAIDLPLDAPCVMRAKGTGETFVLDNFVPVAVEAVDVRDFELAERFAHAAIAAGEVGVDIQILLGHIHASRRAPEKAIPILEKALEQCRGNEPENLVRQTKALSFLSQAYRNRNDLKNARKYIDAALRTTKRLPEREQSVFRPEMLHGLAVTLHLQGDIDGAIKSALAALATIDPHSLAAGLYLGTLGRLYLASGKHDEALVALTRALAVCTQWHAEDNTDIADILADLGRLERKLDHYDLALEYLHRALTIEQKTDSINIAATLRELGLTYYDVGDLEIAEKYLRDAYAHAEKVPSVHNRKLRAGIMHDLGGIFMQRGAYEGALAKFEKALELVSTSQSTHNNRDTEWAALEIDRAYALIEIGEVERGVALLKGAHQRLRSIHGPEHKLAQFAASLLSRVRDGSD